MQPINLADNALWKQRFRITRVMSSQIATKNPSRGLVVSNQSGVFQLYAWDVNTGELRQLTDRPAGTTFGGLSPDGNTIYYFDDEGGNEIGYFVQLPFEATTDTEPVNITPELPPYATFSLSQSLNGAVLSFTAGHGGHFDIYTLSRQSDHTWGRPQLLYRTQRFTVGATLSHDGDYAVIATSERKQSYDFSLMAFNIASDSSQQTVHIIEEDDGSIRPVSFAPVADDTRLLCYTDVTGFDRPMIWDVKTGDRTDIPLQDITGNITPWGWSPDGQKILLRHEYQAKHQLYLYDLERSTLSKLNHPDGTYYGGYFVPGQEAPSTDEIHLIMQDSVQPERVVALDAITGTLKSLVFSGGDVPAGRKWRSVNFPSTGGVDIHAWLATPEGDGSFPAILHTHGGPTSVQTEQFMPLAQAFLDHGFAFLSVNYRGSTTFGREFESAIRGILGHREVDDMAAGHRWLVENNIAEAHSVLLMGGSYGGYLTLQALGRRPDLWAGGMAEVAIADWRLMYEDQAETLRGYQQALFGGTPDELPEQTRASSPITYAYAVEAPVLIIQGYNDTRCPARQMEAYEARLKSAGKDITVHWFDAGHIAGVTEQRIAHAELMLQFAYRVLGQG